VMGKETLDVAALAPEPGSPEWWQKELMPSLALIVHLIDRIDAGLSGPVSRGAAERAAGWCTDLEADAHRLYATVTDTVRVAAALLASKLSGARLASPLTAREVYRHKWTGLTEPRVVQGALECLEELGWIRAEAVRATNGGRPTVRFHVNPLFLTGRYDRSRRVPPEALRSP